MNIQERGCLMMSDSDTPVRADYQHTYQVSKHELVAAVRDDQNTGCKYMDCCILMGADQRPYTLSRTDGNMWLRTPLPVVTELLL